MKQLYKVRQYRRDRYPGPWPFTRATVTVEVALLYMLSPGQYLYSVTLFHQGQQYALNGLAELCHYPKMPDELLKKVTGPIFEYGESVTAFIKHAQRMFWNPKAKPQSREVAEGVPLAMLIDKAKAAAKEAQRPKGFG